MTRYSKRALRFAATLMLTMATSAAADPFAMWNKPAPPQRVARTRPASFATAGTYGGVVGDQVSIDGVLYSLQPKLQPYLIGTGLVAMSEVPIGSHVYATLLGTEQSGVVWGLMVRPADEDREARADMSRFVRLRNENAPR